VSITCEPLSETRLRIAFTDTGTGISPERLERLFTPFERLGADETGVEGTGLGLALSKRLVEAMGGIIAVSSTVGEGSMFAIEMPLTEPQEAALPRDAQDVFLPLPELLNAGETQSVVLYIEDNLSNYDLVQNILRHRPEIKLLAAMQGKVGLELAERHNPDLILLDYHLPDINGDEVLVTLREASETRDIPVVVLSADATPQQIERMTAAGATDYLTKPVDVKRFLAVLDRELGRTERAREGEHKHLMMPERGVGNSGQ
jgi:CheY-like chemotaxis protein